ncbi:phosphate uptake regulator PhoU [Virgibacillus soli]|uniref:PhoU domain-containing protein n=1 Tax=Paracerasibacillus soli TaxID=480284 RepID=A0ABU5CVI8_9BACI|nr:PhoU domain-containing protein [Virgibacillus soli]MDY0409418.1 PhoU domain-containing protein [Virgibacillus soli]
MLIRQNYYEEKRSEIKRLVLQIIDDLIETTDYYHEYLKTSSHELKEDILKNERYIDKNEEKIEQYILEIISLEHLDTMEIKWLFAMSRIIRELERVGDQFINIITLCDTTDSKNIRPMIKAFFEYEKDMMRWLRVGIAEHNVVKLEKVIAHDKNVNDLNKETYSHVVDLINEHEKITESNVKMVMISRFLERVGDHLVNVARKYKEVIAVI